MRRSAQAGKDRERQSAPPVLTWLARARPFPANPQRSQATQLKERIDPVSRPSVLAPESLAGSVHNGPREPQQGSAFGSISNSPRLVAPRQPVIPLSGTAAVQRTQCAGAKPIQRMAVSSYQYKQAGGTCGLYSLGMAISGVDQSKKRAELLKLILLVGNEIGTFVGEFMDANNLAAVARRLGLNVQVINFGDAGDMKTKLTNTGGDGVVMAYSVFDVPSYKADQSLAAFKYLFSHWSVIESLLNDTLTVRDPNNPGTPRDVDAATFWQSNQDASSATDQFSFQEYQQRRNRRVSDLRERWEEDNLDTRAGGAKPRTAFSSSALPSVTLDLKGKIISVSGSVNGEFCRLNDGAKLRNDDENHTERKSLARDDVVEILDKDKAGKSFSLGFWSISREHYWVKTADGAVGWVKKSALDV